MPDATTVCGERTLRGAEARALAEALLNLLEEAYCVAGISRTVLGFFTDLAGIGRHNFYFIGSPDSEPRFEKQRGQEA